MLRNQSMLSQRSLLHPLIPILALTGPVTGCQHTLFEIYRYDNQITLEIMENLGFIDSCVKEKGQGPNEVTKRSDYSGTVKTHLEKLIQPDDIDIYMIACLLLIKHNLNQLDLSTQTQLM